MAEIIAEVGQAHDGSLGILHSYIDAVAETGVKTIKFQTHIGNAESSPHEPFRVNFSYQDASRLDYWNRMTFSSCQWKEIKSHCDEVGLEFLSTPFSIAAVDLLEELGVKRYKIGSGDINNYLLLDAVAETGKPVILSSGLATYSDLDGALKRFSKSNVTLLQCTTEYPTSASSVGLNQIQSLRQHFGVRTGFSDHSGDIAFPVAALALGAEVVEVHVVFSKKMFGPDTLASLTLAELKQLNESCLQISEALASPTEKATIIDSAVKNMFARSLATRKELKKGAIIKRADLECKKPAGMGVDAKDYESLIGKKMIADIGCGEFITERLVE